MSIRKIELFLEIDQYRWLNKEAERKGISFSEFVAQILPGKSARKPAKRDFLGIVGLGRSGRKDISRNHDKYITQAINPK